MRIAIFPGSFDPITKGHEDIILRAIPLFDDIIIAIGNNADKKYMFSLEQRVTFIKDSFKNYNSVSVESYNGLTIDFCKKKNAQFILRGLRNTTDFEFEKSIAQSNKSLSGIETVFLFTEGNLAHISSSIVRDIKRNGGDISAFVPTHISI